MLTASQLDILGKHVASGDRIAYYTALAAFGVPYGSLALDVVLNEGASGSAANSYFLSVAASEGVVVDNATLAQVSLGLMSADFALRSQFGGADLTVDQIQDYHRSVFAAVANVSANAWTPNYYLDSFATLAEREAAWSAMLSSSSAWTFATIVYHFYQVEWTLLSPTLYAGDPDYQYLVALERAGLPNIFGGASNSHGPFNVTVGAGAMVGGDQTDNTLSGTSGNDILIGFDGADTFQSSAGADRYYGGKDDASGLVIDTLSYEKEQSGIKIQLGPLQKDPDLFAPLLASEHDVQAVKDGSGDIDVLIDINRVIGTEQSDILEIRGAISDIADKSGLADVGPSEDHGIDAGGALEVGDTIDVSKASSSGIIALMGDDGATQFKDLSDQWVSSIKVKGFENITATAQSDDIRGNSLANTFMLGDGVDTVDGGGGHDDIHGGLGNDSIVGGDGADYIYDNGAATPIQPNETLDAFVQRVMAYDGAGNDTIFGGKGSDILVYSGGTDVYDGGEDDDLYLVADRAKGTASGTDYLTINLTGDFGHDLIQGDGSGVDLVNFVGLNRADVTVTYDFTKYYLGTTVANFDPLFAWTLQPSHAEVPKYLTVGSMEIKVNATGASLTIQQVTGSYFGTPNGSGLISWEASMFAPFLVHFSDGYLDWRSSVLDPATNYYSFKDGTLSSTATAALDALDRERAIVSDTIPGTANDDDMSGTNASELAMAGGGNDRVRMGGGSDVLVGGLGADTLDGGSGSDTASYAQAVSAIGISTDNSLFASYNIGEAQGDVLISVENIIGSAFNDLINGDGGANDLRGGAGNDTINGQGGNDRVYGEDGNDTIESRFGGGHNELSGGAGNDTITSFAGADTIYGGDGDDQIFTYGEVATYWPTEIWNWGDDQIDGGNGIDTLTFGYHLGGQVIDMVAGRAVFGSDGTIVTFTGIENVTGEIGTDVIYGDAQNNVIRGMDGNDSLYGGAGNDTLHGGAGDDQIFGGIGIDTARINAASTSVSYQFVEGGVRATINTSAPGHTWQMDSGTFTIFKDVEYVQFNDVTLTYAQIAASLQTAFDVVDDYVRTPEGATPVIDLFANDLPYGSNPLQLTKLNGTSVSVGQVLRLASGATVKVLANGQLEFDQAGAFAWLNAGATVTETLTYAATDTTGIERTASVSIVIDGVASAPDALHLSNRAVIAASDTTSAAMTRVANFDIAKGAVIINEVLIDPNALPSGVTVQEINGSTYVLFGDDAVVLDDVSYDAWKYVAAQRAAGGAGNDYFAGTAAGEVLLGGAGNDTINGNGGQDVISGGAGNDQIALGAGGGIAFGEGGADSLTGGTGNDTLYGNAGNDTVYAGTGADLLSGGDGDDLLAGGDGVDTLVGGAGNDTLAGGKGGDSYDGGAGFDILDLQETAGLNAPGIYVDLNAGVVDRGVAGPIEWLVGIEGIFGDGGNDTLIGDSQDNRFDGVAGDDIVRAGQGNDTITDVYGNDTIYGDDGDDYIYDAYGQNLIFGGAGNDRLIAGAGHDTLDGGAGSDMNRAGFAGG